MFFITIEICEADGEVDFLAGLGGGLMIWNFSRKTLRVGEEKAQKKEQVRTNITYVDICLHIITFS